MDYLVSIFVILFYLIIENIDWTPYNELLMAGIFVTGGSYYLARLLNLIPILRR